MSSAGTCPCHLDWSTDIHGARREPVNNEKAWLIFAVRLLSRTVVGKVNGQETVWSQKFKPSWWDQEVGLTWKNPTTNPKDTKQVLMKKFEALQKHLKNEGKFPEVLEGEARLWNAGKFSDLFFMTSVLGVLEKTIDLHSAVTQLCARKGSRIFPDLTLVGSIKNCLAATLSQMDQIGTSDSGVNSRTFSKLGQLGTSYNAVLEKPDSVVLETSNSGISKTSCSDVSLASNIAVNGSTFSKLNQLRTSNSCVLETSGSDILKTSNITVNGRTFLKLGQLETSYNAVLEKPDSDVNSRTFPKLVQLETSYSVVKGKTFSKLGQLGTSYAVLVTSDSAVNGRTLSKLGQLGTSDSAVNGRKLSKLGQLGTSDSAINGRTFPKLGQLGTSDSAVKCRALKRRSSQSSGSSSDVSDHKTQKVDSPAVKNPQVGKSECIARNDLRLC